MGSNQRIKELVVLGLLCYVCEDKPPDFTDEVRGHICLECWQLREHMRLVYALQDGYVLVAPHTD
jgi:hypothetical protein